MAKITWLASYPKSGNTWIRMFLNAFVTKFPLNINSAYQYTSKDNDIALLQLMCPTNASKLTHEEYFIYRPAMLLNRLKMAPVENIILKTHNGKVVVNGFPVIPIVMSNPSIYIVRDPRDICISLSHHMGMTFDQTIEFMNHLQQGLTDENNITSLILTWSKHVETWTVENNDLPMMVIRYEDIGKGVFENILTMLGLDNIDNYDERFHMATEQSSFANLQALEKKYTFIEKGQGDYFFRVGKAGQWKNILTTKQSDKIKSDHYDIMARFGYE